jgi:Dyp-type peroxidase family
MGSGSLAPPRPAMMSAQKQAGTWRLAPDTAAQTQGIVASPFGDLTEAQALFLALPHAPGAARSGGAWLRALTAKLPITDATGKTAPCAVIAFTYSGLHTFSLPADAMDGFSQEFREGMHQIDRQRRLGDDDASMVIGGGPVWSGNIADPVCVSPDDVTPPTAITVHALLLLYEADGERLEALTQDVRATLAGAGVTVSHDLRLSLHADPAIQEVREHFGFADGISQPVPFGDAIVGDNGDAYPADPLHGIASGDVLMGHINAHDEAAPGPLVAAIDDPSHILPDDGAPHGTRNLGLNGSYLVVRELRQYVAAFWTSMDRAAAAIDRPGVDADWVAARMVGRDRNGIPLVPKQALPAPEMGDPLNDFAFVPHDMHGMTCPMGSHMRRANPRDGLAPTPAMAADLLKAANNHRLLRRGRKYGEPAADPRVDDGKERGLLFMCLNTDIARQFEFVQQTWALNPGFAVLDDETDPLLGPPGPMTIPARPLRMRIPVDTYIRLVGGEYFFLPSLPALAYLASL